MDITDKFYEENELQFLITVASCLLTSAPNPKYFSVDPMQYFIIIDNDVLFYDDAKKQYLYYDTVENIDFDYVNISTIRERIKADHSDKLQDMRIIISKW